MLSQNSRITLILISGFILIVLFIFFPIFKPFIDDYSSRIAFDQATWLAANSSDSNPKRTQMVDNLLRKNDFHGKTQAEVEAMLGEPTSMDVFEEWDLSYLLGPERGLFSMDYEWLVFKLDQNSIVIDYRIVVD